MKKLTNIRLTISPSQTLCSLNYFFDRMMRYKREPDRSIYGSYGNCIHSTIRKIIESNGRRIQHYRYFKNQFEAELRHPEMKEFSIVKKDEMMKNAKEVLDVVVKSYLPGILLGTKILEVESRMEYRKICSEPFFKSKIRGTNLNMVVDLVGYADLIGELKRGKRYLVFDWKTGFGESYNRRKRRSKNPDPGLFIQPVVYCFLTSKKYKVPLKDVEFIFVDLSSKNIVEEEISVRSANKVFEELFKSFLKKVASGKVSKTENKRCRYCPHKTRCMLVEREYRIKDFEKEIISNIGEK